MATLIKQTEFNKNLLSKHLLFMDNDCYLIVQKVFDYTYFLTKEISLGDFVACDFDGNVLEKPKFHYTDDALKKFKGLELKIAVSLNEKVKEYQEALLRVVFKGFEYDGTEDNFDYVKKDDFVLIFDRDNVDEIMVSNNIGTEYVKTIEDLIQFNLEVTDTIKEQFNL